ncbi:MAG: hypothetical protein ACTSWN_03045 [Promethearchaeota archaeon]
MNENTHEDNAIISSKSMVKSITMLGLLMATLFIPILTTFFRSFFYTIYPIVHQSIFAGGFMILPNQIAYIIILFGGGVSTGVFLNTLTKKRPSTIKYLQFTSLFTAITLNVMAPFIYPINEDLFNILTLIAFLVGLVYFVLSCIQISSHALKMQKSKILMAIATSFAFFLTYLALWFVLITPELPYFMVAILFSGTLPLIMSDKQKDIQTITIPKTKDVLKRIRPQTSFFKVFTMIYTGCFAGFSTMVSNYSILNFEIIFAKYALENMILACALFSLVHLSWQPRFKQAWVPLIINLCIGITTLVLSYIFKNSIGSIISIIGGGFGVSGFTVNFLDFILLKTFKKQAVNSAYLVTLFSAVLLMVGLGLNYVKFAILLTIPEFQTNQFDVTINLDPDTFIKLPFIEISLGLFVFALIAAIIKMIIQKRRERNVIPEKDKIQIDTKI